MKPEGGRRVVIHSFGSALRAGEDLQRRGLPQPCDSVW
jgi:hypothetical protein